MAYNDDLFCFFICIWATLSSILIQFVLDFLPGKSPVNRHICTGKNSDLDSNKDMTIIRNYSIFFCSLMMILMYAFVNIRIAIFKRDPTINPLSVTIQKIKDKPLSDYVVLAIIILITLINGSIVLKTQTVNMKESHIFPNYIYLHYQNLWLLPTFSMVFISIYFIRNRPIRESFQREVQRLLTTQ